MTEGINTSTPFAKEKVEFENALIQRNFEIELFWKRSWFFGALVLGEIAAYYTVKTDLQGNILPVIVAFITCLTILAQCIMNRGSKYWQERWEYMTMNREAALSIELTRLKKFSDQQFNKWLETKTENDDKNEWFFIDASILAKDENVLTRSRRFSVSKITFLVWDIFFLCSLLCRLNESYSIFSLKPDIELTIKLIIFYTLITAYIYFFWKKGNVFEPYKDFMRKMKKEDLEDFSEKYLKDKVVPPYKH